MNSPKLGSNINIIRVTEALNNEGYVIIKNAFSSVLLEQLHQRITSLTPSELQQAKIGSQSNSRIVNEIRSDKTFWLDNTHQVDHHYLSIMDMLRLQLNEQLFLGLFEYESHYAIYPPGSFYRKHIDVLGTETQMTNNENPVKNQNRVLSSVLYLNKQWSSKLGGELVLYDKNTTVLKTIYPENGSLILFLSNDFPHEVKTTSVTRYSITGWFRVNTVNEIKY